MAKKLFGIKHICMGAIAAALLACAAPSALAQEQSGAVLRRPGEGGPRGSRNDSGAPAGVTPRLAQRMEQQEVSDADLQWMRVIYRQLDLTKDPNTPLYYPDEPIDGQENLFRIMMRLLADNEVAAYEYLDGREAFTDEYRLKVRDILDRFHIYYTEAKGSSEKNPKFTIDEADVPANEVLNYYIVERWEFDKLTNRMRTRIEAICPVLSREGDFGGEAVKYPMFWMKMDDLRPYLTTQNIFTSDDNNLATCTYADYFQLGLYEGDIYKTRNLRNRSLMQIHQDPEALKHAQDSIQERLTGFEKKLWVPTLDELAARREAAEAAEAAAAEAAELAAAEPQLDEDGNPIEVAEKPKAADEKKTTTRTKRGAKSEKKPAATKRAKVKKEPKAKSSQSAASSAQKSVRNRRKK